jgi:DNA polymerase
MPALFIDLESRSACDLTKTGSFVYANHFTTEVICMAYAFDKEPVELWTSTQPFPKRITDYISNDGIVHAHNAVFEFNMWNYCLAKKYMLPQLKIEQMECTMAKCYSKSLPGNLEEAAIALNLKNQKDLAGKRVMLQLSRPRSIVNEITLYYEREDFPEKFEILFQYCIQDVEVEREISSVLAPLPEIEKKIWMLDYEINHRGVEVDTYSIKIALKIIDEEKEFLDNQMQHFTDGKVEGCQSVAQITKWIRDQGIDVTGIGKTDLKDLQSKELPENVRQVLRLRQMSGKSSTAKLKSMLEGSYSDNRIREMFQYHGANTGRWAGRRVQLQNLPRPQLKQKEIDDIFKIFHQCAPQNVRDNINLFYAPPLVAISDCLRSFLKAKEGSRFIVVDWSAIEARILAWLAGQESILEIFRTSGLIYEHAASGIYKIHLNEVTKDQRFIGKLSVLALGYQGGKKAFQGMAKVYGLDITEEEADDIKIKWRTANPKIVQYWYALEQAAINAIINPGTPFKAGAKNREVTYTMKNSFLYCELPSKRTIAYPYSKIEKMKWFDTEKNQIKYKTRNAMTKKWEDSTLYGGLLAENICQAVARDVLRDAMLSLDNAGYKIVATIHDEVICEMPFGEGSLDGMKKLMCENSSWAKDLPLSAEGWEGLRYVK